MRLDVMVHPQLRLSPPVQLMSTALTLLPLIETSMPIVPFCNPHLSFAAVTRVSIVACRFFAALASCVTRPTRTTTNASPATIC